MTLAPQVALLILENRNLRTGLFLKEREKISRLFPGRTRSLATSDGFIGELVLMDGEKEQTKTKKAKHKQNLPLGKYCGPGQRWNRRNSIRHMLLQIDFI